MSDEIEVEPIPGLPHHLPPGERILWQGRPRWRGLARHTFQVGWIAVYFAVFTVARGIMALQQGQGLAHAALAVAIVLPLAALCLGILSLLAWLHARATVYTLTTRRVVMRFGVALPMTFNLPFKQIAAAHLKTHESGADDTGDIALQLIGPDRIAWLHLWPHARPWHITKAQPMLREVPDAARVSALLAEAVRMWSTTDGVAVAVSADRPLPAGQTQAAQNGIQLAIEAAR